MAMNLNLCQSLDNGWSVELWNSGNLEPPAQHMHINFVKIHKIHFDIETYN
jgi:hypothetical protein